VVYAQSIIDNDKSLKAILSLKHGLKNPHIAIFTEQVVPKTMIEHNKVSYTFYGILDYAISFIPQYKIGEYMLSIGSKYNAMQMHCETEI
jgi:hypothetical protein